MYPISKQITSIGFSRDLLVTNPVTNEKKSQIQGNLHQWFRMHNPTGIIHIPKTQKNVTDKKSLPLFRNQKIAW